MRIGFDLDGIFIGKPPFVPRRIIEWLYKGHNHALSYRFPSKPEQFFRKATHIYFLRPPIQENIAFLRDNTIKDKNKYYLISSRFSFLKPETEIVLKKYKLRDYVDGIYLNSDDKQPHIFKNAMIKKLGIELFIDDDLPLTEFLAKENPQTKFIWLNEYKNAKELRNLFFLTNLHDIVVHII